MKLFVLLFASILCTLLVQSQEPNPPKWPSSVSVFSAQDLPEEIQTTIDDAFALNGGYNPQTGVWDDWAQFSPHRFALLFKPGNYSVEVPVGYYTQVLGLGLQPDDVIFTSQRGVYSPEDDRTHSTGALDTFWRGAENFRQTSDMMWAVSQACPLRRVHLDGKLFLFDYLHGSGYASGGFFADSQVNGQVVYGPQQQFMSRNNAIEGISNAGWNYVFVGTQTRQPLLSSPAITNISKTPVIAEKPFVSANSDGTFQLNVPGVRLDSQGPGWSEPLEASIPFSQVFVTDPERDTAETINAKLAQGLHLVISPGIYNLMAPLQIQYSHTVVLGLGIATLVAANGSSVIQVADELTGVRIGGLLLQAGVKPTPSLLQWGTPNDHGNTKSVGFLYDIACRVGGPDRVEVQADTMIAIHSPNIVGDNFWLWRADHTVSGEVYNGTNPVQHALRVTGSGVTMYGLATEHTLADVVVWTGDKGATYFFQCELPYDVNSSRWADNVGYRVADTVVSHQMKGGGVYSYFRDHPVEAVSGFACPSGLEANFESVFTVWLNGQGGIQHVVNKLGPASDSSVPDSPNRWTH